MLCPKCKIEAMNCSENGSWVAKCRNPKCVNYGKVIAVIIDKKAEPEEKTE